MRKKTASDFTSDASSDGRHTTDHSRKIEPHRHQHRRRATSAQELQCTRQLDPTPHSIPSRPGFPAWPFRFHVESLHSTNGGGCFSRFGTRDSGKLVPSSHRLNLHPFVQYKFSIDLSLCLSTVHFYDTPPRLRLWYTSPASISHFLCSLSLSSCAIMRFIPFKLGDR